jgi:hypothetical protein
LSSLLIERAKILRAKPCSRFQFDYFEKLVGRKIPPEKFYTNEISNMYIVTPDENIYRGKMKVLNF